MDATRGSTVSFHNVSFEASIRKLPGSCSSRITVLSDLSGVMSPGMNAIMGPTGCGKSSLLDALAGRKDPQHLSGLILLDGRRQPPSIHRYLCGYVVQDNIALGALTVRENIAFSASLRLPRSISSKQRETRVSRVIAELGLTAVADRLLGTEFIRGVSGGERKRTCIGIELVKDPLVLFLDEPTSGLDAYMAGSVMKTLRRLADTGRTVVFSIHQPKYLIYRLFDRLTLISNGQMIYHGPCGQTPIDYFNHLGYFLEGYNNPADFFMDVIHGEMAPNLATTETFLSDDDDTPSATDVREPHGARAVHRFVHLWRKSKLYLQCEAALLRVYQIYESLPGRQSDTDCRTRSSYCRESRSSSPQPNRTRHPCSLSMSPCTTANLLPPSCECRTKHRSCHQLDIPSELETQSSASDQSLTGLFNQRSDEHCPACPLTFVSPASLPMSDIFSPIDNAEISFESRDLYSFSSKSDCASCFPNQFVDSLQPLVSKIVPATAPYVVSSHSFVSQSGTVSNNRTVSSTGNTLLVCDDRFHPSCCYSTFNRATYSPTDRAGFIKPGCRPNCIKDLCSTPYSISFCQQLTLLVYRQCLCLLRDCKTIITHFAVQLIVAVFIGVIYYDLDQSAESGIQNRSGLFFFVCMQLLFINSSMIDSFLRERVLFRHETAAGFYRVSAYFFSKIISEVLPVKALPAVLFLPITYVMAGLRYTLRAFLFWELTVTLLTITASAVTFSVSAMVSDYRVGETLLSMFFVLMMITGGFLINVSSLGSWFSWLRYFSIVRFAMNAFLINELVGVPFCSKSDYLSLNLSTYSMSTTSKEPSCILGEQYLETQAVAYGSNFAVWGNELGIFGVFLLALLNGYVYLRLKTKYK